MAEKKYRGIEASQEVDSKQLRPETRRLTTRAKQYFLTTDGVITAMMMAPILAIAMIKLPFSGEIMVLVLWMFYKMYVDPGHTDPKRKGGRRIKYDFPYRVPGHAKIFDGSIPDYKLGEGITFLGKETSNKLEIWLGNSDLRTHLLVLGTTGSGKTELLLGLVYNALVQNSGFIYTDGKGDVSLFENVFRLARYLGREDDLVVINFLTSGRDFLDKQKDRTTNTMNPFALGSSGMLIELIISLMDDAGGGGDMWKGRAISFVAGLTRALCFLRDRGYLLLDANKFIEYFELPVVEKMVWDRVITENGQEVKIEDPLFNKVLEPLKAFILTLPGYKREAKGNQEQKTVEQHGFITMQLTRLFGDMSFTYGYIFQTTLGEVDMYDVVINRRILVVLLPALERAPDSLKMLGKLIVGAIKQMMAGCLGNRLEGSVREIIEARPTRAAVPFYVVLDEYGYYAVLGFAVAPAQARSLGFCIVFAAQDFSSLQKASKEEADATWENTNMRIIGRLASGKESETFRRVVGVSGEAQVHQITRKDHEGGALMEGYRTVRDTSITGAQRVEYDDLAEQENGEFTFLVGKKRKDGGGGVRVIRARTFYTQVDEKPREIRVNHFIKIEPPRNGTHDQEMEVIEALEAALKELLSSGKIKEIFADDPFVMARNKQPVALLQVGLFLREARSQQKLSLGEAVRVALVCTDKEADAVQAMAMAKIEERKRDEAAANAELQQSAEAAAAAEVPESAIEHVAAPDDANMSLSAGADGLPQEQVEVAEVVVALETDKDGDAAATDAATDGDDSKQGGKGGSAGSGGGTTHVMAPDEATQDTAIFMQTSHVAAKATAAVAEVMAVEEQAPSDPQEDSAVTTMPAAAATVRDFLDADDYDYKVPVAATAKKISTFTFRAIGEGEETEPTPQSKYVEDRIAQADILIGAKQDIVAIRNDARNSVKAIEEATTYVKGSVPEPPTLPAMDSLIDALKDAAERGSNDFD